jgi:hypothetical protein
MERRRLKMKILALKRQTSIPTPAIDHLYIYFDPAANPMPEGSAWLPLDWRFLWRIVGMLAVLLAIMLLL